MQSPFKNTTVNENMTERSKKIETMLSMMRRMVQKDNNIE